MDYIFEQNNEAKSIFEKNLENKNKKIEDFKKVNCKRYKSAFPDAELNFVKEED